MTSPAALTAGRAAPAADGAWRVCIASGVVAALGGALIWSSTLGVFMLPLQREFGWSRADISLGITLLTFTTPLLAPLAGWLIDRVDLRRLVLTCLVLQSLVLAAAGQVGADVRAFYALCIAMAVVSYGASVLPLSKIVVEWFDSARGRALGVLFAFTSLGPIVHPLLAQTMQERFGWRAAYGLLAGIVGVLGGLVAWLWVRERRRAAVPARAVAAAPNSAAQASMLPLLADRAWWALAGWSALYAFGAGAIGLHLVPMLTDRGATAAQAAGAMSLLGVGLLVGNLVAGTLFDRLPARALASALMLAPVMAALMLWWLPGVTAGIAAALLLGLAAGGESSALVFLVGRCFAPAVYGRAYATQTVPLALAAGIGPWMSGVLYGRHGDYALALALAALAFALAALAPWLLPRSRVEEPAPLQA
jgi:MFS family permease